MTKPHRHSTLQALEQGDTKQAQFTFAEMLRTKEAEGYEEIEESAAARYLGAVAYLNNPKAALAAYQKVVELNPDNADGWSHLRILLTRTGELAQAEAAYRNVLSLAEVHQDKQEQTMALGNLGLVYWACGELDKAEEMYWKALELNQALSHKEYMAANYGNLGNLYEESGNLTQAEAALGKSLYLYQEMGAMQHPDAKKVQRWLDKLAQHRASQPAPTTDTPR